MTSFSVEWTPVPQGSPRVSFSVEWTPVPQGSPRVFANGGRVGVANSGELRAYREAIAIVAKKWCPEPLEGPVTVEVLFLLPRPKSVSRMKRPYPAVKPDIDKLLRAALDALTGIAYKDDAQVISVVAEKRYLGPPFVYSSDLGRTIFKIDQT